MRKLAIAITVLAVLALLALAVFRGQASRELILERNGLPLANLKGNIIPYEVAGAPVLPTSTDPDGRLDLSNLPSGAHMIRVWLSDGAGIVHNSSISVPTSGSCTIDRRGSRTICTTKRTYADFGLFKLTGQEVEVDDWADDKNTSSVPSQEATQTPLPDGGAKPTDSPSSRPGS